MPPSKGWYSRGCFPHFDAPGEIQAVTFRLADSLPGKLIASRKQSLKDSPGQSAASKLHAKIATCEDAGHGSCLLRIPAHASTVQNALLHFDGDRYIRDHDHYLNAKAYIRNNPVKAGLCKEPGNWEFSSAWKDREV